MIKILPIRKGIFVQLCPCYAIPWHHHSHPTPGLRLSREWMEFQYRYATAWLCAMALEVENNRNWDISYLYIHTRVCACTYRHVERLVMTCIYKKKMFSGYVRKNAFLLFLFVVAHACHSSKLSYGE